MGFSTVNLTHSRNSELQLTVPAVVPSFPGPRYGPACMCPGCNDHLAVDFNRIDNFQPDSLANFGVRRTQVFGEP